MPLDRGILDELVALLTPLLGSEQERRALLTQALTGSPVLKRIDFTGPTEPFAVNMLNTLADYGEVEPGTPALWALLKTAHLQLGADKQPGIDALREIIHQLPAPRYDFDDYIISRHTSVFISYAREDRQFAERLGRDLQDAGLTVWADFRSVPGGVQWRGSIARGMDRARVVVLVLSPEALASDWVNNELKMARERNLRVMPVMLRDCAGALPPELAAIQYVDFRPGYGPAFTYLLASLQVAPELPDEGAIEITSPFKGLEAFQEVDSPYFFGRDALVEAMIDQLRARPGQDETRFLAVIGASGSGKSSAVRAGLIPRLREGALPGSETWPVVTFTPGARPLENLAQRLLPLVGGELWALLDSLEAKPDRLNLAIRSALAAEPDGARVVLVADQFEEVFTSADETARSCFLEALLYAATIDGGQTIVVITLRADFYAQCTRYTALSNLLKYHQEIVTPMSRESLRGAIVEPAKVAGLEYERGLVALLLDDVRGQEAGALPLLQYALQELYERRTGHLLTCKAYEQIDGVRGALAQRAEEVYARLVSEGLGNITQRVLLRLVEVGGEGEPTRRRVERERLTFDGVDDADVNEALQTLTHPDARLLVAGRDLESGAVWIEVSHEALLREWDRLRTWIAEHEESLRLSSTLLKDAQEWDATGRDQSYLLRGKRLIDAETWLDSPDVDPDLVQREYIETSQALRESELQEERDRQQQELDTAHQLAELERRHSEAQTQAITRLRWLVALLIFIITLTPFLIVIIAPTVIDWINRQNMRAQALGDTMSFEDGKITIAESRLNLEPFAIDRYEVTNRQYRLCVEAGACTDPASQDRLYDDEWVYHPVVNVTAFQASEYCQWLGRRLPTEAEWEFAARGFEGRDWPWGDEPPDETRLHVAFGLPDDSAGPQPVSSYPQGKTPEGVFNLSGNVMEWTASPYTEGGYLAPWDGNPATAPEMLIMRGGGFLSPLMEADPTARLPVHPASAAEDMGFRCAQSTP